MSTTRDTLQLYWRYTWRDPIRTLGWLLLIPIGIGLEWFAIPFISAHILDTLAGRPHAPFATFTSILILAAVLEVIGVVAWRVAVWVIWRQQINVNRQLYTDSFSHLMTQSEQFHADHFGGALVSAITKFTSAYYVLSDTVAFNFYSILWAYLFTVIILWPRAPLFVVILLAATAVFAGVTYLLKRRELRAWTALADAENLQTGQLADAITNISTVRSFGHERFEESLFARRTNTSAAKHRVVMTLHNRNEGVTGAFVRSLNLTALIISIIVVTRFHEPIGTILLITSYLGTLFGQLWGLSWAIRSVNRAIGDASEMTQLLARAPDIADPAEPQPFKLARNLGDGEIRFEGVGFRYHESATKDLFTNLNLTVAPGERVGLVGPSGGGKTTITKLLLRFADIQDGAITIDGQNIAAVRQTELRQHIAYVPQEPLLFHRSLADNIRYGRLDATDAEVEQAARRARATEFIDVLPKGYATLVGERGTKLSGGQRQRVAIARAMLKNAPILVLDEATSALDSHSEKLIQAALHELMAGRTTIVIAHRLSTIAELDRIIVLDRGKVVQEGSHQELLERGGLYARLWAHQSGGFLTDAKDADTKAATAKK